MTTRLIRVGAVDDWVRTAAAHLRADVVPLGPDLPPGPLLVSCGVSGLNLVLRRLLPADRIAETEVGWVPDPDRVSRSLATALGLPARPTLAAEVAHGGTPRPVRITRDDHGGLLLLRGTIEPATGRRLGAQAWHDDQRIADGRVRRIEVGPDYAADCAVTARVGRRDTTGRVVQVACDPAVVTVEGVRRGQPVRKWTWYADPRHSWLLRRAAPG